MLVVLFRFLLRDAKSVILALHHIAYVSPTFIVSSSRKHFGVGGGGGGGLVLEWK